MKTNFFQLVTLTLFMLTSFLTKRNAQAWKLIGNAGIDTTKNFVGTTDKKALIFRTMNLERMRIQVGGNVGIGTKSPSARLNVNSPRDNVSLTDPGVFMLGNATGYNMAMDNSNIQARYKGSAYNLSLNQYGGTVYVGHYLYSSYGLVGAGKYEGLYGYTYDSSGIGVYGSSSLYYGVYGYTGGGLGSSDPNLSAGVYGYNGSYGDGVIGHCYGGSGILGYSDNYIGVYAVGNSNSYAGFFNGNVYTTGTYLPSDLKLKQNVKDLTSAMNIINQLHPKQYEYRQDGNYKLMDLPKGNRSLTNGMNNITITAGTLASGQYPYSLLIDAKKVDTKNMTITN